MFAEKDPDDIDFASAIKLDKTGIFKCILDKKNCDFILNYIHRQKEKVSD